MVFELPKTQYPDAVVQDIVKGALRDQALLARMRFDQFRAECSEFERTFEMSSEEFKQKFENGELGDSEQWFDWFAALRGRELWRVKAQVLDEVAG